MNVSFNATRLELVAIVLQVLMILMVLFTGGGSGLFTAVILAVPLWALVKNVLARPYPPASSPPPGADRPQTYRPSEPTEEGREPGGSALNRWADRRQGRTERETREDGF